MPVLPDMDCYDKFLSNYKKIFSHSKSDISARIKKNQPNESLLNSYSVLPPKMNLSSTVIPQIERRNKERHHEQPLFEDNSDERLSGTRNQQQYDNRRHSNCCVGEKRRSSSNKRNSSIDSDFLKPSKFVSIKPADSVCRNNFHLLATATSAAPASSAPVVHAVSPFATAASAAPSTSVRSASNNSVTCIAPASSSVPAPSTVSERFTAATTFVFPPVSAAPDAVENFVHESNMAAVENERNQRIKAYLESLESELNRSNSQILQSLDEVSNQV